MNLGHLGQRRALMLATGLAALQLVGITVPALAHSPTPQGNKLWSNGATSQYKWDATVPSAHWLRPAMTDVIQSGWASPSSNNSNGVRFSYGATGQGVVYYTSSSGGICGGGWLGCADARYVPTWKIWIRSNPITAGWENWCDLESDMGCPDAGRVAIHEVGHVGGYLEHYDTGFGATRMTPLPPTKDTNEWNTRTLGRCDEARLQLMYDLDSKWGAYANCFEDFPNSGPGDGLVTDLSAAPTNIVVCSGQQATVSGRLNVHNFANYAALADNGVWGRTISIKRGGSPYTSRTTTSGGGNNWSLSLTLSTRVTITYNDTAQYIRPSGEGLDSSPIRGFSITWLRPTDC